MDTADREKYREIGRGFAGRILEGVAVAGLVVAFLALMFVIGGVA
jgi:hypothetical protein